MSSEINLALVQELVKGTINHNYVLAATLTVLVFDLIDSFEKEIKYFWHPRKSAVTALYFTNRYGAILLTMVQLLSRLYYLIGIFDVVVMICIDWILVQRVFALYSRGRAIRIFLFSAFGASAIAGIGIAIHVVVVLDPRTISIAPGLTACLENAPPSVEAISSWLVPIAYDALLMALALYKAAAMWKESAGLNGLSLVKVLIRDQAMYFMAVIFVCLADTVSNVVDRTSLISAILTAAGNPAFLSILGARLLFNMKEAGEKGLNQGTSCPTRSTVSEIDFAAPPAGAGESSLGEAAEDGEAGTEKVV